MNSKNLGMKCYYALIIGLLFIFLLLSGCTSMVPSTDEGQVTQVINQYFQAINGINREKALSYTIPDGAAYEATNKFFDNKVPLAEDIGTQYEYSFEIKTVSITGDSARVEITYNFRLIGFTDITSPTFNGTFTLKKINGIWLLSSAPLAS